MSPIDPLSRSFPPVARADARLLILGSMPGTVSLLAAQYYAHPRNLFWPFMGECVGATPGLSYPARLSRLTAAGIALWDVLACCERPGSLDSAIRDHTAQANDFTALFRSHPRITTVLFNGAKAEHSYRRLVLPDLGPAGLHYRRLPSTSPANASQRASAKLAAWRQALSDAGIDVGG